MKYNMSQILPLVIHIERKERIEKIEKSFNKDYVTNTLKELCDSETDAING